MSDRSSEYEPILPTTNALKHQQQTQASRSRWRYGGFEYQKRVWEATARRSHRLRVVAALQLALGILASWNYLWCVCARFAGSVVGMLKRRIVVLGSPTSSARSSAPWGSRPSGRTR